jgi:hypothetical protein
MLFKETVSLHWKLYETRKYCNVFVGSISQWNFITLKVQYTTVNYSQQLF